MVRKPYLGITSCLLVIHPRGEKTEIANLADDLAKRFPDDTLVRFNYLPTLRAQIALNRDQPSQAIEVLQAAVPYELGTPPLSASERQSSVVLGGQAPDKDVG